MRKYLTAYRHAVLSHNKKAVLNLLDEEYVKEQHDDFMQGGTEQFLNELFCGKETNLQQFKYLKFEKITEMKFIEVKDEYGYPEVFYEVSTNANTVIASWQLTKKTKNGKINYGLFGAVG